MKQSILRSATLVLGLGLLASLPAAAQTFNQYVALGDSLTAGFESGCLVQRNQVNSFPAVIARTTGVSDFEQPLVQEVPVQSPPGTVCLGAIFIPPATVTVGPVSQMGLPLNAALARPYNNLGIPGIEVQEVLPLTHGDPTSPDPLLRTSALVLRNVTGSPFDGTNAVMQADALLAPASTGHTLVTVWYGNNNTLGASTSGIVIDGVTLISQADFQSALQEIIASIQPAPSRLVIANIPDVTSIPFSTTIPPVLVDPTTRQPVVIGGSLVPLLGPGDAAYPCTPVPPDHGCALPPGTLVNLPASSLLAAGVGIPVAAGGTGLPLPVGGITPGGPQAGVLLYPDMVALLQQRTDEYNSVIAATASSSGATLVDANAVLKRVALEGYDVGGIHLTASFLTGGIFSYDGVHPSSIGYTIVASEFLKAMNEQGDEQFAQPNFSDVLFTPNVPATGAASVTAGGPWGYSYEMWRGLLASVSSKAAAAALPEVRPAAPVVPQRPTPRTVRSVERSRADRD